jgi:hypothetical protein
MDALEVDREGGETLFQCDISSITSSMSLARKKPNKNTTYTRENNKENGSPLLWPRDRSTLFREGEQSPDLRIERCTQLFYLFIMRNPAAEHVRPGKENPMPYGSWK